MVLYHKGTDDRSLFSLLKNKKINWVGNQKLKIYGTLHCKSGKRMNKQNRVFFSAEREAIELGYRPCGHCMRSAYKQWKDGLI